MITKHSATPWILRESMANGNMFVYGESSDPIAGVKRVARDRSIEENEANAEFIVKACNSHDRLIESLSELLSECAKAGVCSLYQSPSGSHEPVPLGDAINKCRDLLEELS